MPKKLVVRINNIEAIESPASRQDSDETVIYHWHRIIGFAAFLMLLAGLTIFLVMTLVFDDSQPGDQSMNTDTGLVAEEDIGKPEAGTAPESGLLETNQAMTKAPVASGDLDLDRASKPGPAIAELQEKPSSATADMSDSKLVSAELQAGESVPGESEIKNLPATSAGQRPEIQVFTSGFQRVQLTSALKNKEPVDEIDSVLYMNEQGLIRVYLFTEMSGLKGKTFYHNWYLGEKQMARVKVPAYSQLTRASSSKFIDRFMKGNWRVEIDDGSGLVVATAEFSVE